MVAVLLVAVVHAVQDVVAAPAPRDAVRSVQAQELVLAALLHAADLSGRWTATTSPAPSESFKMRSSKIPA